MVVMVGWQCPVVRACLSSSVGSGVSPQPPPKGGPGEARSQ